MQSLPAVLTAKGRQFYNTKSSSSMIFSYLNKKKKNIKPLCEDEDNAFFFSKDDEKIHWKTASKSIDNNAKKLKYNQDKYTTILFRIPKNRYGYIVESPEKLHEFIRESMKRYTENLVFQDGSTVDKNDLLWYATILNNYDLIEKNKSSQEESLSKKEIKILSVYLNELLEENRVYLEAREEILSSFTNFIRNIKNKKARSGDKPTIEGSLKRGDGTQVVMVLSTQSKDGKFYLNPKIKKIKLKVNQWQEQNRSEIESINQKESSKETEKFLDKLLEEDRKETEKFWDKLLEEGRFDFPDLEKIK